MVEKKEIKKDKKKKDLKRNRKIDKKHVLILLILFVLILFSFIIILKKRKKAENPLANLTEIEKEVVKKRVDRQIKKSNESKNELGGEEKVIYEKKYLNIINDKPSQEIIAISKNLNNENTSFNDTQKFEIMSRFSSVNGKIVLDNEKKSFLEYEAKYIEEESKKYFDGGININNIDKKYVKGDKLVIDYVFFLKDEYLINVDKVELEVKEGNEIVTFTITEYKKNKQGNKGEKIKKYLIEFQLKEDYHFVSKIKLLEKF